MIYRTLKMILIYVLILMLYGCDLGEGYNRGNTTPSPSKVETKSSSTPIPTIIPILTPLPLPTQELINISDSANQNTADNNLRIYNRDEIEKILDNKEKSIMSIIKIEYKESMYRLEEELTCYNKVIAAINYNIGGFHYYLYKDNNEPIWSTETPRAYEYIKNRPEFPMVYSGISNDYIKVIVILQPIYEEHSQYKEVVNDMRGNEKEYEFINGLRSIMGSKGYYAVDIYVEDLLELNRELSFDRIVLLDDWEDYNVEEKRNLSKNQNDAELEKYLKHYQREVNYSNSLNNKEWNLFLFQKTEQQPYNICIGLTTFGKHEVNAIR